MVLKSKTKFSKESIGARVYFPEKLATDSSFPFKHGDEISMEVVGKKIVIEKKENGDE